MEQITDDKLEIALVPLLINIYGFVDDPENRK
jgi:hypothetical protein